MPVTITPGYTFGPNERLVNAKLNQLAQPIGTGDDNEGAQLVLLRSQLITIPVSSFGNTFAATNEETVDFPFVGAIADPQPIWHIQVLNPETFETVAGFDSRLFYYRAQCVADDTLQIVVRAHLNLTSLATAPDMELRVTMFILEEEEE